MSLNLNYKPDVLVDTENLSREEWLRYRRKGIGGSDAAAVLGLSPFCTKRDLYYDKTGIQAVVDEEEDNWVAKEVGHRLEDLVAEIYAKQTGLTVFPVRKMFFHPLYPFMLADVDFFIEYPDGSTGILECKTTGYHGKEKWENDSVPVNYEYQGRHYMAVMNLNRVVFACLYGNNENDFIVREMERDLEIEEALIRELTGQQMVSHRAPGGVIHDYSLGLFAERGYIASSNWRDSDGPFIHELEGKKIPLVELPKDSIFDDTAYDFYTDSAPERYELKSPGEMLEIWKEEFDSLAAEGRMINFVLHPQFIGRVSRVNMLKELIGYMLSRGAWIATNKEAAEWVLKESGMGLPQR